MRANAALLDALHAGVCSALVEELERALIRASEHPNDPAYAVSPQLLDKIMKFLSMNGVTAPATSPRIDALATVLADLDLDEEAAYGRH